MRKNPLWVLSQSAWSSVKAERFTYHSQLSTPQNMEWSTISPIGMKVIHEFRLQDVLKKKEERSKIKKAHHKTQKQQLKKVSRYLVDNIVTIILGRVN